MHKFTSSLGLFLAVANLALAAPSPAEASVPAALVRANVALLTEAGASPSANDAGHSSALKPPPKACLSPGDLCPPDGICCQGFCIVFHLLDDLMYLSLKGGVCSSIVCVRTPTKDRQKEFDLEADAS